MSLLGNNPATANAAASAPAAKAKLSAEEKKAKRDAKKQKRYKLGLAVKAFVEAAGKPIPPDVAEGIKLFAKAPGERSGGGFGGTPIFNKLFGASPKVGDSITLQHVFDVTSQGVSKMNGVIRKLAEKGIVIEYQADAQKASLSKYVIKSMA